MAAVRHLEFLKFLYLDIWLSTVIKFQMCSCLENFIKIRQFFCQTWQLNENWLSSFGQKRFSTLWLSILNVNVFTPGHVTITEFQMCCCVVCTKFHQNRMIFVAIWWFHDFQDGRYPPSWILGSNNGFFEKPIAYRISHWSSTEAMALKCLFFLRKSRFCTHFGDRQIDRKNRQIAPPRKAALAVASGGFNKQQKHQHLNFCFLKLAMGFLFFLNIFTAILY